MHTVRHAGDSRAAPDDRGGADVRIEITGVERLQRALTEAGARANEGAAAGLTRVAETIISDAVPLVPVDTGTLRASHLVQPPEMSESNVTVTFGFGGAASDYAVVVHERMDVHHPVGQAKFLEEPTLAHADTLANELAAHIERYIRGA